MTSGEIKFTRLSRKFLRLSRKYETKTLAAASRLAYDIWHETANSTRDFLGGFGFARPRLGAD
jgi:meiotically up-regulated gene 157 (Mug157) protein